MRAPRRELLLSPAMLVAACVLLTPRAADAGEYEQLGTLEREAVDSVLTARRLALEPAPQGKRLRAIQVVNLDVFTERDGCTLQWFNRFHATTRERIIAREVLLRPGQPWRQDLVDETRRNLRDPFLSNVVVLLPVRTPDPAEVDLLVVTRDVWSLRLNSNFEVQDGILTQLVFSLSENNFAGWRKKVAFAFIMDQGAFEVGPSFSDRNVAGTRLVLASTARAVFARDSGAFEGTRSHTEFGYPLWSLASKWGASTEIDHYDAVVRRFRGAALLGYAVPGDKRVGESLPVALDVPASTRQSLVLPVEYDYKVVTAQTRAVRSFGRAVKQQVSVGHELALARASVTDDFAGDDAARAAFEADVLPRSELSSAAFVRYVLYTPEYTALRDLDTFDFREDLRIGPTLDLKLSGASQVLGSDVDFVRVSGVAGWGARIRGGYQVVSAGWQARLQEGDFIDNVVSANLYMATPKLARLLRVVLSVDLDLLVDETANHTLSLGGDRGLRGYEIGAFSSTLGASSAARLIGHVELRSAPLKLAFLRLGGVAFWDAGHAADRLEDLVIQHDVGVGFRLLIPQLDTFVMRADWAVPLQGPTAGLPGRVSLGSFQVF